MVLIQKVAKVLLTLSCCIATYADAGSRQINLTLHSFTQVKVNGENVTDKTDNQTSAMASRASQTSQSMQPSLTLNRVSKSPITKSKAKVNLQDLVAVALDEQGNELSRQIIKNPLFFRAEVFDEGTGAMTFSKDIKRPSAVLNLILPDDNKLHSVKIYQPKQQNQQLVLQQVDEITLEQPQAQAAMSDTLNSKALSQNSASSNVIKVLDNGDSTNRVDLVFLSEGYTNSQLAQFSTDVNNIISGYFNVPPYKEYKNLYNVWRVEVASNQTGAGTGGRPIDTRFGANFGCYGIDRLLCVDEGRVTSYINSIMPSHQADQVVVVVNTTTYGGAGGTVATMSLAPAAIDLALHEVGHSFGHLGDEYTNGTCITSEPFEPNVTTSAYGSKWSHWLSASNVDAYQGARYCTSGMYRPTYDSMMNHLGVPFYQVNEEALVLRTYDFVSPIDSVSPATNVVEMLAGQQQSFNVNTVQPIPDTMQVSWYLDQVFKASGKQLTINADELGNGTYTLVAKVKDTTSKVIKDSYQNTEASFSWSIKTNGSCSNTIPTELVASNVTSNNFLLSWAATANATSYMIEVNEGSSWLTKATVTQNSANLSGFNVGSTVQVRVSAISTCGSSEPSTSLIVSLTNDMEIPAVPSNLSVSAVTHNSMILSWGSSAQATSYTVERWLDSDGWVNVGNTNTAAIAVNGLSNKDQWLHVKANNTLGSSTFSDYLHVELADIATCSAISDPEKPTASNISASGFTLNWSATTGADIYQVQLWQDATSSWQTIQSVSSTSYNISGLTGSTAYARIVAGNACDDEPKASDWLSITLADSCQYAPNVPTGLSFSSLTSSNFTANWQAVADSTSYQVQLWNGQWVDAGTSANTALSVNKLNGGSAEYFHVKASNACGSSEYSAYYTVQ
ncbi:M64 family metallopeptidase [Colwellia psychrerythraea]|uniref:Peptidase M64, IgA n=1 Tax=Colwellia psychrerythraea TaxID=28229 RepID=A0A099KZE0_COLPS|nr:M64 family metallopeptidase [Colwellia psychrerythraea]KGJ95202.1 Peptidase M64, IgA [Colwellia psychrerythraea]